ncbi:hypothetical protein L207DRAFT_547478 [Hyaloscypha variabilis F]|uniref:Myb-like domain-containing protein n=1 Tax=Hyaloscypha variabilis (strain UAMH 11265 / GT02V1 / F) TaxID=1149755 RepID=A0A2J6R6K6_HYAVF|nr:hypothetical protein L207DRAFT_547478 [Hyaloscypha variabilis F]
MFINAELRSVSNGFEAFVPFHRAEVVHQRLVEMTNNDVNAWSVYRPVASSTPSIWDQQIDDFGNENFSVQSPYTGYHQEASSAVPRQPADCSKTSSYTYTPKPQCQPNKNSAVAEQQYEESASSMNFIQKQSPMLGHDYPQWSLGRGRGSFAEFSKVRDVLKDFPCQASAEPNLTTFTPVSSAQQLQGSYQDDSLSLGASFNMNRTNPGTAYSSYSPMTASVDPRSLISCLDNGHGPSTKTGWWSQTLADSRYRDEISCGVQMPYDGLPKCQAEESQQQYCDLWNTVPRGADDWTAQTIASSTISPKVLTLNVSSTPSSSSGSSQEAMMGLSRPSNITTSSESSDQSGPETLAVVEPPSHSHRQRQALPESIPISRRIVPVLPSNDFVSNENNKKRSTKVVKSGRNGRRRSSPVPPSTPSNKHLSSWRAGVAAPRPKKIVPKPVTPEPEYSRSNYSQSSATAQAMHHRDAKDDFLVRSKLAGMSYKEIRRQGKFSEAESTLRGRFRTLTKHKAARVRKPEWDDNDIRLLKKAVRKLTKGDPKKCKVPWKQVADYIATNGGSYHFGNATCRKRWDELQARSDH